MGVSLGSVALDDRLLLRGTFESPKVQTYQTRLLSGSLKVISKPINSRILTLTTDGPNDVKYGLFTREQLVSLAAIRDSGSTVIFIHELETFNVIIPSDGIAIQAIIESHAKQITDKYSGTITLIEVV